MNTALENASIELLLEELSAAESGYLNVVWDSLADRVLTKEEIALVSEAAKSRGLNRDDRTRLHSQLLKHLAIACLANGEMQDSTRSDILRVGRLLGIKEDAAQSIVEDAGKESDHLATLLLGLNESPKTELVKTRSSWNPAAWASATVASAACVAAFGARITAPQTVHCEKCKKETSHRYKILDKFPMSKWGSLLWNAKTPSIQGFALNAATMAAADRKLMSETGQSLIPKMACNKCGTACSTMKAASKLLETTRAPKALTGPVDAGATGH